MAGYLSGLSVTPANGTVLASMVAPSPSRVRLVVGSAVLDLRKNGASMYHGSAVRPTIAAGTTGKFTLASPTDSSVRQFDVLSLLVLTAGGHGTVVATAALEESL